MQIIGFGNWIIFLHPFRTDTFVLLMAHSIAILCRKKINKALNCYSELFGRWKLLEFTYKKIVISYGDLCQTKSTTQKAPQFSSIVQVTWSSSDGAVIKFGEVGGISAANPHSMALSQFTTQLNQHKCLSDTLLQIIRSHKLCKALGRLPITCSVGTVLDPTVQLPRTHFSGLWCEFFFRDLCLQPLLNILNFLHQTFFSPLKKARQNFSVICESPCHYRLIFRGYYAIDLLVDKDDQVFVRDGAHSKFSNQNLLDGWRPISGLLSFLRSLGMTTSLKFLYQYREVLIKTIIDAQCISL